MGVFLFYKYSCLDQAVSRQEFYGQSVRMGTQVMELLVRHVCIQWAAEQRVNLLAQKVAKLKEKLEVAEASAYFQNNGKC